MLCLGTGEQLRQSGRIATQHDEKPLRGYHAVDLVVKRDPGVEIVDAHQKLIDVADRDMRKRAH